LAATPSWNKSAAAEGEKSFPRIDPTDGFDQKMAITLVRTAADSAVLERLPNERQILAGLDHPNAARLLDGGITDDGVPFLVMELVVGTPIDSYCGARKLSIPCRLELFRQGCFEVSLPAEVSQRLAECESQIGLP